MEQNIPRGFALILDGGFGFCREECHKHNVRSVIFFSLGKGLNLIFLQPCQCFNP